MSEEEAVEPQEHFEEIIDQAIDEDIQQDAVETEVEQKQVPLSALQKERKKRQEIELELKWERDRQQRTAVPQQPAEEDDSMYESATRKDLNKAQQDVIKEVEERLWMRQNPEKLEKINEYLPEFLKQRPNLASAINSAPNRYEEAYTLMEALTPRQQTQLKQQAAPKKEAPGSPNGMPKAAALNQTADVMTMSDSEFSAWRNSQKRRR